MKIVIKGRLDGLNEYTRACRGSWQSGMKMKQRNEMLVAAQCAGIPTIEGQVFIAFYWYEPDKKRDKDNIAFGKKFILDALVKKRVIQGDSWKYIEGFRDSFYVDKDNPRVEIIIKKSGG